MRTLLEFASLIVFFVLYKFYDIYVATAGLMVTAVIQIALCKVIYKDLTKQELITFGMIMVFGALTLAFQSPDFIIWKVTLIKFLFAGILIGSQVMGHNLLKKMMGKELVVADNIWNQVNIAWAGFFALTGVLNLYVAYNYSEEFWVEFKTFWMFGITIVFMVLSMVYLFKKRKTS